MLNILVLILGVVFGVISEGFLMSFGVFSLVYVCILFAFGKVDWRLLLSFVVTISICLDVIGHYALGVYLLVYAVSIGILLLVSLFIPSGDSLYGLVPSFVSFWVYGMLITILPKLVSFGEWVGFSFSLMFRSFLVAIFSLIVMKALSWILERIRGDKMSSRLRLK